MSVRKSTAAMSSSKMLSTYQNGGNGNVPMTPQNESAGAMSQSQSAKRFPSGVSRALMMEAKIAEENQKKKTIAQAPKFMSASRAYRRFNQDLLTPQKSVKKLFVQDKTPIPPSLYTLERARKRS